MGGVVYDLVEFIYKFGDYFLVYCFYRGVLFCSIFECFDLFVCCLKVVLFRFFVFCSIYVIVVD